MANPAAAELFGALLAGFGAGDDFGETLGMDMAKMIGSMPISKLVGFSGGALTDDQLLGMLESVNARSEPAPVS